MVENEFKVMLNEQQYDTISAMFAWNKRVEQTNYYFDTPDFYLFTNHITCRVRAVSGKFLLQMKLPNGESYSRIEVEQELGDTLPDAFTGAQLSALCGREGLPDVALLGSLSTVRLVKDFGGAEIDLDKSSYFGKTDCELEIEFTDEVAARAILATIKEKAGITTGNVVCKGKVYRFLDEYKKTI